MSEFTAVLKQEDDWWVGWIEEVPGVNCQERSYELLKETLEATLKEALEFNRQGAKHSWWHNPALHKRSAIPRPTEIKDILARKICKDLGVEPFR